ncbi:MAG: hypothetical protein N2517_04240 [Ignavibacteria bacterium]|nr:hypothetical protein [Ignavibacteria bacterium]
MAKKEANELENGGAPANEVKEEKKQSSSLGLIHILAIVGGSLLILILATRFIFLPYIREALELQDPTKQEAKMKEEESRKKLDPFADVDKKLIRFVQTGRITTNPLNSEQFVVVNLSFRFSAKDEKVLKESVIEGGEGSTTLQPEIMGRIRGKINQMLGSSTVQDLQQQRTNLPLIFKDSLKHIFEYHELNLGEVFLEEFIIQ